MKYIVDAENFQIQLKNPVKILIKGGLYSIHQRLTKPFSPTLNRLQNTTMPIRIKEKDTLQMKKPANSNFFRAIGLKHEPPEARLFLQSIHINLGYPNDN